MQYIEVLGTALNTGTPTYRAYWNFLKPIYASASVMLVLVLVLAHPPPGAVSNKDQERPWSLLKLSQNFLKLIYARIILNNSEIKFEFELAQAHPPTGVVWVLIT